MVCTRTAAGPRGSHRCHPRGASQAYIGLSLSAAGAVDNVRDTEELEVLFDAICQCQIGRPVSGELGDTHRRCRADASEVWVLNPKMLKAFIEREPMVLSSEDVGLVASRIAKEPEAANRSVRAGQVNARVPLNIDSRPGR